MHLLNMKVNSLLNETLKKVLKCVPLTHGEVYSRDETLRKPVNGAPLKDGKVHSQVNETMMKPQSTHL